MRFVAAQQNAFVAGEFSPDLYGRSDLKAYENGAKSLENLIVKRTGGIVRRSGTIHVANVKDSAQNTRSVPFRRSSGVNFVLEFGFNYIRFFRNHLPVLSGGVPYEVATPFSAAQIDDLRFVQSADVLYIVHPAFKPYKLSHFADTTWTLAQGVFTAGPLLNQNIVRTTKIQASAATGTVTLTATAAIFAAGDVGGIWKLRYQDASNLSKWAGGVDFVAGDIALSRGKFYQAQNTRASGVEAPSHTEGIESDGRVTGSGTAGVNWLYLHSGYANVTIVSFISATQVTATVETGMTIPADIVSTGSYRWQRAAWSPAEGWPTSVAFFQERLCFGKGNVWYASTVNDFENLSPTNKDGDVTADSALRFVLSDPKIDVIRWIAPTQAVALIGGDAAEATIGAQNVSNAFGPSNIAAFKQTAHGSVAFLQPERVDDAILFVNGQGRRLYEMTIASTGAEQYATRELSILADHLLKNQGFEAAYCESPDGVYWLATNAGELVGMTYEKAQDVVAWHHHPIGGVNAFVESICAIPDPNNRYTELWLQVARTIGGQIIRSIEYMSQPWGDVTQMADAAFLDCATWANVFGAVITGLSYLEGETVDVMADGIDRGTFVVSGGQITLPTSVARAGVGFGYRSRLETLSPDPQSEVGASQGHQQRVVRARVRFERTAHCKIGTNLGPLDVVTLQTGTQPMDQPMVLFTGMKEVPFPGGYDGEPTVVIEQDRPLSLEIQGIAWDMTVAPR